MFPETSFVGGDYAGSMIENAHNNVRQHQAANLALVEYDVTSPKDLATFDFVYTTRCLINLADWKAQQRALANIAAVLDRDGTYVMIENFADGHRDMNRVREAFGLPEIKIRDQ
jgi:ubiquinone/menaquinone biosynthesis C-methylase UbiE